MQHSPLLSAYREHGDELAPYRGCLTRVDGGAHVVLGAAWPAGQVLLYDAAWRSVLRVAGPEARKWLNGMITANVRDLPVGAVAASFQLDPKGHILATLDVACTGEDTFLLLSDEDQRAGLLERLKRFVFIAKLTIEDLSENLCALQLRGADWGEAWTRAGESAEDLAPGRCRSSIRASEKGPEERVLIMSTPGGIPQLEFWCSPAEVVELWGRLTRVSTPAGSAIQERDRILSRQPRYGTDITEAELPQETGQLDRLDYTKGCYVGQEIVERIRARGAVHRHWVGLKLDGFAAAGTELESEGKPVGRLTSVAERADGHWFGLGYLRAPHDQPGATVAAGNIRAQVES